MYQSTHEMRRAPKKGQGVSPTMEAQNIDPFKLLKGVPQTIGKPQNGWFIVENPVKVDDD